MKAATPASMAELRFLGAPRARAVLRAATAVSTAPLMRPEQGAASVMARPATREKRMAEAFILAVVGSGVDVERQKFGRAEIEVKRAGE